ncbi:hypothetical protein [Cupriavidus sp. CuC1]|uniref:hypothetical protein n=1 Tax=Cupriavidus sp. CuC1 TaxID=3373131 RepID=UPI0037D1426C
MANVRTLERSFAGGEVTPEFFGRIDDVKFQTGAAKMRNFLALPHGPAANRPGFGFVREVKDSTQKTRIIPFVYSTTQTMVIEVGAGYFRFHTQGATLMNGGVPYEITNTFAAADLFDIHYVQSADVLTLVHPNYPPQELRRLGALNWTLTSITFTPTITAPTGVASVATQATSPSNLRDYSYVVTAIGSNGKDESLASTSALTAPQNNLLQTGAYNTITWAAVSGAVRYNVYLQRNGLYGYIGQTDGLTFKDDNITPDLSKTPPLQYNPFPGVGAYPGAVSYFEQRRCFAGTLNSPQNIWMTKSGTESNMAYSLPTRDDDSINIRVSAREANTIRHLVPLSNLVLLTSSAEWRMTSINTDAITPSSVSVRPQSYIGANNVQPIIVNNNLLYAAARGGHVREMAYAWQANGYITGDLSLRAPHLFDGQNIVDMAYAKSPQPICWFVSDSGKLLGLTYVPEQQVGAWHWHDTDGAFESVAVVAEGNEDVLYAVISRTIGGVQKRYVERMASRRFATQADAFFVDAGLTYSGAAATVISGLSHLEGKTVSILGDGSVFPQAVVTGGQVTLAFAASKVQIGLPITADLQTLPLAMQIDNGFGQGRAKNVNKAWLRVYNSGGISIGPDANTLVPAKQRTTEPYGTATALKTDEIPDMLTPTWAAAGQIFVRQSDPLPLTIVSLTLEVAIGG